MNGFVSSLIMVVFPLASEFKDDKEKLLKLYTKATKIISLLVVFVFTSIVINNKLFLTLWMGSDFAAQSSGLLILHIACFGLISILAISWQMTEGLGFPQFNTATAGFCTIFSILLMIVLITDHGNFGVAVARLAGFAMIFLSIFIVERWFFGAIQKSFWFSLVGNLTLASVSTAAIEFGITSFLPMTWITFLLSVFFGGLAYCFILWLLDFVTTDEKILIKRALGR